ncbi:hypothetical protein B0H14DRAFT_2700807 [Mycena olivaceomarginata]|nr:hypothetical protein B0H14DRAFT_2700807 [Mycena olivaceomarginata]
MNPARTSDEPVFLLFPTGSVEPLESATSPNVPPPTLRPRHPQFLSGPEILVRAIRPEPGAPLISARAVTLPASPTSIVFPCVLQPCTATGVDPTLSTSRTCAASPLAAVAPPLLRHRIDAALRIVRSLRPHLHYTPIRGAAARYSPIRAARPRSPSRRAPRCPHLCLAATVHALCVPSLVAPLASARRSPLHTADDSGITRPAPRRPVPEIAFVQHRHARPQYRHDRPSTTIVFVGSHWTSHSPVSHPIL